MASRRPKHCFPRSARAQPAAPTPRDRGLHRPRATPASLAVSGSRGADHGGSGLCLRLTTELPRTAVGEQGEKDWAQERPREPQERPRPIPQEAESGVETRPLSPRGTDSSRGLPGEGRTCGLGSFPRPRGSQDWLWPRRCPGAEAMASVSAGSPSSVRPGLRLSAPHFPMVTRLLTPQGPCVGTHSPTPSSQGR